MSSPTASMSFMDGQSLPIRLSKEEIDSLEIPSEFFGTALTMLHRADPCSRFIACVSGPAQTSGAIPWHIQYQFTDVGDFDALKLEDSKFSSVNERECGKVEVMLKSKVPTAASLNTSWHGPKPFSEDGSVELKYSQLRGFETSNSLGQYPVHFEKAYNAFGRRLTIPTDHPTGSVDIVARLIVGVDDIATLMTDVANKRAGKDAIELSTRVSMLQSEREAAEQDRAMHDMITGLVDE